jgi:molecular chaperone DnaK (HSP70)
MIFKDNEIPITNSRRFYTIANNQASVALRVHQSEDKDERIRIDDINFIGEAVLSLPPNTPASSPIDVTMELSSDGTLKVRGENPQTGEYVIGEFKTDMTYTESEFEDALKRINAIAAASDI